MNVIKMFLPCLHVGFCKLSVKQSVTARYVSISLAYFYTTVEPPVLYQAGYFVGVGVSNLTVYIASLVQRPKTRLATCYAFAGKKSYGRK